MKKFIALLMIAAMLLCICACKKEDAPDMQDNSDGMVTEETTREFYKSEVATNEVVTPYGNLAYPTEWKDNVKVVTSEENGNYRIAFNAIFGETGVPLYAITFGKCEKGFLLGEVPYGDSLVCVYCEDYTSTSVEHLTQDQQDKYSKMCGDINTIISHLVYDCGMIIN